MSPGGAVLRLHGVTRVHGEGPTRVEALRGVSFAVHAGSGKSTLLTIAGGLDQPTEGRVEVEGTDLVALPQAAVRQPLRQVGRSPVQVGIAQRSASVDYRNGVRLGTGLLD